MEEEEEKKVLAREWPQPLVTTLPRNIRRSGPPGPRRPLAPMVRGSKWVRKSGVEKINLGEQSYTNPQMHWLPWKTSLDLVPLILKKRILTSIKNDAQDLEHSIIQHQQKRIYSKNTKLPPQLCLGLTKILSITPSNGALIVAGSIGTISAGPSTVNLTGKHKISNNKIIPIPL